MAILMSILYIALVGLTAHVVGEALPRAWFHFDRAPYRAFRWERDGAIYQRLNIQRWKDALPDKSRHARGVFKKEIRQTPTAATIERFLQETCVAECIHWVLMLFSPGLLLFLPGTSGIVATALYALSNIPFILIQRYNRPRLLRLYRRLTNRAGAPAAEAAHPAPQAVPAHSAS